MDSTPDEVGGPGWDDVCEKVDAIPSCIEISFGSPASMWVITIAGAMPEVVRKAMLEVGRRLNVMESFLVPGHSAPRGL
jgi:hypothetical protein